MTQEEANEALLSAAHKCDVEALKAALAAGADANVPTGYGRSIADILAFNGRAECLKLLIDSGADVTHCSALITAAYVGYDECVKMLVAAGADVNAPNDCDETPLMYMVEYGCADAVRMLLDAGADVHAVSSVNDKKVQLKPSCPQPQKEEIRELLSTAKKNAELSPEQEKVQADILSAVSDNRVEALKSLIESGGNINAVSNKGESVLVKAAILGHVECIKLLLDAGAGKKEEALIYAAHYGVEAGVKLLLEAGADANARRYIHLQNRSGLMTPLVAASTPEVLKLLLAAGANVNSHNLSPLDAIFEQGDKRTTGIDYGWKIKMLIDAGADVNLRNPLTKSIRRGYGVEVVKLLVEAGANVTRSLAPLFDDREPPLMAAAFSGDVEVAEFLIAAGADVNVSHFDASALSYAVARRDLSMVELLLKHGADVSAADEKTSLIHALCSYARSFVDWGNPHKSFVPLLKILITSGVNVNHNRCGDKDHEPPLVGLIRLFKGVMTEEYAKRDTKAKQSALVTVYKKSVAMLLKAGADVNVFGEPWFGGLSALMEAVQVGLPEVVEMLLFAGADVNAVTERGKDVWKIKSECAAPMKKQIKLLLEAAKAGNLISLTSDKKSEPKKATKNATTKKTTPSKKPTTKKKAE